MFLHVHALSLHIIMPKVNANIVYGSHIDSTNGFFYALKCALNILSHKLCQHFISIVISGAFFVC